MKSLCILLIASLLLPGPALAQSVSSGPSEDNFQLSADQQRLFQGYQASSSAAGSLFSGDALKYNGLFTTPNTQLGGAAPIGNFSSGPVIPPTQSTQTNVDSAQFLVLTSKFEADKTPITHDSVVKITVTMQNVSQTDITNIVLKAELQDKNATLLKEPAPDPALKSGSSIDAGLTWDRRVVNGKSVPIDLKPNEKTTFTWAVKANSDDSILRWKFTATFGAGESILLQWIPITNPNPQASSSTGGTSTAGGSYNNPCASTGGSGPFPDGDTGAQLIPLFYQHWKIKLVDATYQYEDPQFHGILKAWWEALTRVECTPYLQDGWITTQDLNIIADTENASGWGYYAGNFNQHMNIGNMVNMTASMLRQNLIHELGHVWSRTPRNVATYTPFETQISGHGSPNPWVSGYNGYVTPGDAPNEDFASAVGYYAIREQVEMHDGGFGPYCPTKNPYDWGQAIYYNWVKTNVFGGKEFGPPAPNPPTSC